MSKHLFNTQSRFLFGVGSLFLVCALLNVLTVGLFVPARGRHLSLVSVVGLLIWYVLIAQSVSNKEAHWN